MAAEISILNRSTTEKSCFFCAPSKECTHFVLNMQGELTPAIPHKLTQKDMQGEVGSICTRTEKQQRSTFIVN